MRKRRKWKAELDDASGLRRKGEGKTGEEIAEPKLATNL